MERASGIGTGKVLDDAWRRGGGTNMIATLIVTEVLPDDVKVEVVPLHVAKTTVTGEEKCINSHRTVPATAEAGETGQSH